MTRTLRYAWSRERDRYGAADTCVWVCVRTRVKAIEKYRIQTFFGAANERSLQTSCGYLLFYQARTVDNALDQLSSPTKVSPRGTGTTAAAAAAAVPSHSQHMANGGVSSTARP